MPSTRQVFMQNTDAQFMKGVTFSSKTNDYSRERHDLFSCYKKRNFASSSFLSLKLDLKGLKFFFYVQNERLRKRKHMIFDKTLPWVLKYVTHIMKTEKTISIRIWPNCNLLDWVKDMFLSLKKQWETFRIYKCKICDESEQSEIQDYTVLH